MTKILIVEDDLLLAKMYSDKFLAEGNAVELAADGQQGLEKAKNQLPDIILLDIMMPKVNGVETLKKLKADEATKNIPVIMLTNLSGTNDIQIALEGGAVGYIIKSDYTPAQVVKLITDTLTPKVTS